MPDSSAFLRLYNAADDVIGDIWQYDDLVLSRARKPDPDSVTVTVRRNTPSASLLEQDWVFARPVINGSVKPWVFVLDEDTEDERDPDQDVRTIRASFVGIESYLEHAVVYPENHDPSTTGEEVATATSDGNTVVLGHRFADDSAGWVMRTLINRARNRGALPHLQVDFTRDLDSNGSTWDEEEKFDEVYTVGTSYKSILDSLAGVGWCQYKFTNFTLSLYRPDTLGVDRPGVVLQSLGYVRAAPRTKRRLETKSAMLVHGDQNALYERVDAATAAVIGRREGFYRRSGVYQLGSIRKLARFALNSQKQVLESLTLTMVAQECPYEPGVDFDVWDTIYWDGLPGEPLRVNTITQRWTAQGEQTIEVELLDRISDRADRLNQLLERVRQPDAPDAKLPQPIQPIPTIPPDGYEYPDWPGGVSGGSGGVGGYFGMVYIQPNEPQGVGKGTFWFDTDDFSV